ncbi:glycosyltransferase family 2 protein [Falsibacillus pallidus]|uniref:GT2 family glycosyltransferase n=1 Tax=Falsibacillus pallidus TaxID=493781 RepID=A0A370G9X0_9BACI|nr:glycosyltransferase family 2 protein [Falsibacillus pallidus]RDI39990.1 GT2 family glycosyltransferase [Falsibacillus pallidus]
MKTIEVSVVIPTFNRPIQLCELLESLHRQTFQSFEVIIVNDNGASVDFVNGLYPELEITVINPPGKLQHVRARIAGVHAAKGTYIMLCDDDDLLLPGHMERMMQEIQSADLVYSDVEIFHYLLHKDRREATGKHLFAYSNEIKDMQKFSTYVPSGSLYRKSLHEEIGYFDPDMHNYWDWDFYLRTSRQHKIKRVPEASVLYAFGNNDNNSSNLESMRLYLDRLCIKHQLGYLPTNNFWLLLDDPATVNRKSDSNRTWNGIIEPSRLAINGDIFSVIN